MSNRKARLKKIENREMLTGHDILTINDFYAGLHGGHALRTIIKYANGKELDITEQVIGADGAVEPIADKFAKVVTRYPSGAEEVWVGGVKPLTPSEYFDLMFTTEGGK